MRLATHFLAWLECKPRLDLGAHEAVRDAVGVSLALDVIAEADAAGRHSAST
jgi:hypothetical protein